MVMIGNDVVCVGSHYVGCDRDHPKRGIDRQGLNENGVVDQKGIEELKGRMIVIKWIME
jgi:hypothetical protein